MDQSLPDDNAMSQVKRITANKFPEAETGAKISLEFGTPWPLSDEFYLVNNNDGIYLLDIHGNKDLIYKSPGLRPIDPIPVRPRKIPNILPVKTAQGDNAHAIKERATIGIMNVNITDAFGTLPKNRPVKQLRIIQILPKTTPISNVPKVSPSPDKWGGNIARQPLGVVPVGDDGSVYFYAPIEREIYFQLLDEKGMAVQSMRSGTYVHAGEQLTCIGCHESKWESIPPIKSPLALQRAPSMMKPELKNQYPFGFYSHVKPVFDKSCVPCHMQKNAEPKRMEYSDIIRRYAFYFQGGGSITAALHSGSRTLPGKFGASFSKMGKALMNKTHQDALAAGIFSREDIKTINLWLDCNSDELSAFNDEKGQKLGKRVAPDLDWNPQNPTGVEIKREVHMRDRWMRTPLNSYVHAVGRKLVIHVSGNSGFRELALHDVNGKPVWKAGGSNQSGSDYIIPGHTLSRGVYFLIIRRPGGREVQKVVLR